MKKIITGILCLTLLACNRSKDQEFTTNIPPQQSNQLIPWLEKQKANVASETGKKAITDLEASLLINESVIRPSADGKKLMLTPIKQEAHRENQTSSTFLLLQLNSDGTIAKGNILTYTPETASAPVTLPENLFETYYGGGTMPDVKLNFKTLTGRPMYETSYRNGKLYAHSYPENKKRGNKDGTTSRDECVEWYWQTYVNGVLVSEVYLFTTCGPYVEEGGGGSGEELFDEAAEEALKAQVFATQSELQEQNVSITSPDPTGVPFQWVVVKNAYDLWQVVSSDVANGYNSSNTGALVYNIQHNGSEITGQTSWNRIPRNPNGVSIPLIRLTWLETSSSFIIANGYISGTVTVSGTLRNFGISLGTYTQSCTINVN